MVRELVIVGAGGHGREVLDVVEAVNAASVTATDIKALILSRPLRKAANPSP